MRKTDFLIIGRGVMGLSIARQLKQLHKELHLNQCGKLVVAKDRTELAAMNELVRRGKAKGNSCIFLWEQYERFGNCKFSELVDVLVRQAG